jgi:DNA-binding response OmpR family regulator
MYATARALNVVPAEPTPAPLEITITVRVPGGDEQASTLATQLVRQLQALAADTEVALNVPAVPAPRLGLTHRSRIRIRPAAREVLRDGVVVPLTRLEFDLLTYLAQRPRQIHRRERLLRQVWDQEPLGHDRTIDVHIRRLRQKVGGDLPLIRTVRGVGYGLHAAADIQLEAAD